jgi:hypothetical protein
MAVTRGNPNSTHKEKMMKTNSMKWFFVGAFTVAASLSALAVVNIPNSFTAGQPIKAADVNDNFSSLKTFVDTLEGTLSTHNHSGQAWTSTAGIVLKATTGTGLAALYGDNTGNSSGSGVEGHANGALAAGVFGVNPGGPGLWGRSTNQAGVYAESTSGYGGYFHSDSGPGIRIKTESSNNNLIYALGPGDNNSEFLVDYLGNGVFRGNVTASTGTFSGNVTANGVLLTSDRNAKKNFSSINSLAILEKVARLPISSWTYKTDTNNLRHIGPMAQDFHKIFGLNGKDDKHISSIDEQGVALAAIQGLYQQNQKLTAQLKSLEARFAKLEQK